MDLKFDPKSDLRPCPSCKHGRTFHGLVYEIVVDLQPTTVKREKTGLLVCSKCGTVIFDESAKE